MRSQMLVELIWQAQLVMLSVQCHVSLMGMNESRLTVVSREAKKGQTNRQKTKHATNYCMSFTRANVFVIWRHNHSQYLSSRVNF